MPPAQITVSTATAQSITPEEISLMRESRGMEGANRIICRMYSQHTAEEQKRVDVPQIATGCQESSLLLKATDMKKQFSQPAECNIGK